MTRLRLSLAVQTPEVEATLPVALLQGSFEAKLRKAAEFGADGVELIAVDPDALDAASIRALAGQCGLEIAAVASGGMAFAAGLTLLNADPDKARLAQDRLNGLVRLAEALEAPLVTIGSFRGRLAWGGPHGRELLAERLRQAAEYAGSRGVRLALEPLNRYEADLILNAAEGLDFVAQVDHPALGLLLDTYHVNIEECSWTEPFGRVCQAGRLFHVHLGDNNRLYPGGGLIDFGAILAELNACGYSGYLSAELLPRPDPDTAARRTIAHMRGLQEGC